jgi:2-keto-3-deoxy-L-rhamnonate aldolase RhmA
MRSILAHKAHSLANGEDIVRQLREEPVGIVSVNAAGAVTVGETGSVVEVARINKEQVDVLILRNLLHSVDEASKVAKVAGVVGLWEGRLLVAK